MCSLWFVRRRTWLLRNKASTSHVMTSKWRQSPSCWLAGIGCVMAVVLVGLRLARSATLICITHPTGWMLGCMNQTRWIHSTGWTTGCMFVYTTLPLSNRLWYSQFSKRLDNQLHRANGVVVKATALNSTFKHFIRKFNARIPTITSMSFSDL